MHTHIKHLQNLLHWCNFDSIYWNKTMYTSQLWNISSLRTNIDVFSLKPDKRRKRRSHGVRLSGLSRSKQKFNMSFWSFADCQKQQSTWVDTSSLSGIKIETYPGWCRSRSLSNMDSFHSTFCWLKHDLKSWTTVLSFTLIERVEMDTWAAVFQKKRTTYSTSC